VSRRPVPDTDDFPVLICTAFDALPGPDEERLAAIGARLDAQLAGPRKRRGNRWLWLWLLLAGGTVAAAWWASEYLLEQSGSEMIGERPAAVQGQSLSSGSEESAGQDSERDSETRIRQDDSPIIYRRETN